MRRQRYRSLSDLRRNALAADVLELGRVWRNWQTQLAHNVPGESPCGFDSHHPHPGIDPQRDTCDLAVML